MKYGYDAALPENFSLDRVKQVLEARGCTWVQRIPEGELQLAEEIWLLPNDRGVVRYIYDHFVEVPSIHAGTDIRNEATKILMDLETDLPFLYTEDLVEPALASEWRRYALRALASTTKGFRGDVIAAFKAALKDPEPTIRQLALVCIGRYPAFSFAKELDDQALVEVDPGIKDWQLELAEGIRKYGKRGTLW